MLSDEVKSYINSILSITKKQSDAILALQNRTTALELIQIITNSKYAANNVLFDLFSVSCDTFTSGSGALSYTIDTSNKIETQSESGIVLFTISNGSIYDSSIVKLGATQSLTSGTYTVVFSITETNPCVVSVIGTSNLATPGNSVIRYTILNLNELSNESLTIL